MLLCGHMGLRSWHLEHRDAETCDYIQGMTTAQLVHCCLPCSQSCACYVSSLDGVYISAYVVQPVPKGTNGGVSTIGTLCGAAGSLLMGLTFWGFGLLSSAESLTIPTLWKCLVLALIGGVFGNLLDSYLGATLQYSGYSFSKKCIVDFPNLDVVHISGRSMLSNTQVNFLSAWHTSVFVSFIAVVLA